MCCIFFQHHRPQTGWNLSPHLFWFISSAKRECLGWKNIIYFVNNYFLPDLINSLYNIAKGVYSKLRDNLNSDRYFSLHYSWFTDLNKSRLVIAHRSCQNMFLIAIAHLFDALIRDYNVAFPDGFNHNIITKAILSRTNPRFMYWSMRLGLLNLFIRFNKYFQKLLTFFFNTVIIAQIYAAF